MNEIYECTDKEFSLTEIGHGNIRLSLGLTSYHMTPQDAITLGERLTKLGVQTRWNRSTEPTHGETNDVIS